MLDDLMYHEYPRIVPTLIVPSRRTVSKQEGAGEPSVQVHSGLKRSKMVGVHDMDATVSNLGCEMGQYQRGSIRTDTSVA